jgi:hypothetical protein
MAIERAVPYKSEVLYLNKSKASWEKVLITIMTREADMIIFFIDIN